MTQRREKAPGLSRPLAWAVALHVALILLLTVGFDWWKDEPTPPSGQAIEAEVIDPAALDAAR
ncbi:MAG: cell envelope integrity protein TolA, partial [Pseudomonadota bacterium]